MQNRIHILQAPESDDVSISVNGCGIATEQIRAARWQIEQGEGGEPARMILSFPIDVLAIETLNDERSV